MITVFAFTDPVCVWCWAAEALLRALETHYPGTVDIRHIAGGMIKDIKDFEDSGAGLVGRQSMDEINASIARHYEETASTHGMPVMTEGFRLFSEAHPSSWPQNIAFKAAQIASPQNAHRFLRRVRQATMAQALPTGEAQVLYELAGASGIDLKAYAKALTDGSALAAFEEDLRFGAENSVDLFPTFILKYKDRSLRLSGFVPYQDFSAAITRLSQGEVLPQASPPEDEALLALTQKYQTLSAEEIRQAFDFDQGLKPEAWCKRLEKDGRLLKAPLGQSWVIQGV